MGFDFFTLGIVLSGADGGCAHCVEELANEVICKLNLTQEQRMLLLEGLNKGALWGEYSWHEESKSVQHYEGNMN